VNNSAKAAAINRLEEECPRRNIGSTDKSHEHGMCRHIYIVGRGLCCVRREMIAMVYIGGRVIGPTEAQVAFDEMKRSHD